MENAAECAALNKNVLAGLEDLFAQLRQSESLIGRDDQRIVLDFQKMPSIVLSSIDEIFSGMCLVSPSAMARIFDSFLSDGSELVFFNIRSIDALKQEQFAYLDEIQTLFNSLPRLSQEQSEAFAQIQAKISEQAAQFLAENMRELIDAIFGMAPSDFVEGTPDARTLN